MIRLGVICTWFFYWCQVRLIKCSYVYLNGGETVAKGKYEKWLKTENLILLEGWARDGLTDEQIAKNMGISVKSLFNWKTNYLPILQALKKGKEVVDYEVENALLSSALEGNTTAQIFWLKNRRPDKWRDKVEANKGTDNSIKVVIGDDLKGLIE